MKAEKNNLPPEGANRAPAEYFTGVAWIKPLVPANDKTDCSVNSVTFEAGARNNWHYHPSGQVLVIIEGTCHYQEKGKPVQIFNQGEAINIDPDIIHWHGASPDHRMTHLAINPKASKGAVIWKERVTDEEYNA